VTQREPSENGLTFRALEIPPDIPDKEKHIEILQNLKQEGEAEISSDAQRPSSLRKNPRHSDGLLIQFSSTNQRRLACAGHFRIKGGYFRTSRRKHGCRQTIR
jgi:hypothetical protein